MMPTYTGKCEVCGELHTYIRKVADRNDTPECCGAKTTKVLDTPEISAMAWTGHKGMVMYDKDAKPVHIEDGAAYHRYLRDNNKIPESEGRREAEIQKANREAKQKEQLRKDVETVVRAAKNK
jgi:predicted nucleic acid-binding Zn ribbon protein